MTNPSGVLRWSITVNCGIGSKKNKDGKTPQETLGDELLDVNDPRRSPPVKLEHLPYFIFGSLAIVYKSNPIQNKSDLLSGIAVICSSLLLC